MLEYKADMNNNGALEIMIPNHDKEHEKKDQKLAITKVSLQQKVHNLLERCDNIIENVKTNVSVYNSFIVCLLYYHFC